MEEMNESFCNITEKFPAMEWSYTVTVNHPVIFFFFSTVKATISIEHKN